MLALTTSKKSSDSAALPVGLGKQIQRQYPGDEPSLSPWSSVLTVHLYLSGSFKPKMLCLGTVTQLGCGGLLAFSVIFCDVKVQPAMGAAALKWTPLLLSNKRSLLLL